MSTLSMPVDRGERMGKERRSACWFISQTLFPLLLRLGKTTCSYLRAIAAETATFSLIGHAELQLPDQVLVTCAHETAGRRKWPT